MITLGVIGDFGVKSPNSEQVAELVKSWSPDAIVTTGDNMYNCSPSVKNYTKVIGSLYPEYLPLSHSQQQKQQQQPRNKSSSRLILRDKNHEPVLTATKFLPCVGNHDFSCNYNGYCAYFGLNTYYSTEFIPRAPPAAAAAAAAADTEPNPNANNILKLISVNNYIDTDGSFERKGSTQRKWLEDELSSSTHFKWIIVYFHYPQLCSNSDPEENNLKRKFPFHSYRNVALVLSGHQHIYERLELNKITNVVIGTSGHSVRRKNRQPLAQTKVIDSSGYGALQLQVTHAKIQGSYWVVDGRRKVGPKLVDSFQIV